MYSEPPSGTVTHPMTPKYSELPVYSDYLPMYSELTGGGTTTHPSTVNYPLGLLHTHSAHTRTMPTVLHSLQDTPNNDTHKHPTYSFLNTTQ